MKRLSLLFTAFIILSSNAHSQKISSWRLTDLRSAMNDSKGPIIINFWATFCKPCIAELPHFQALANQYKDKGVKLIMVSVDLKEAFPARVTSFAKKLSLTSPVIFLDESNADIFCPAVDSSWSGAIPASIFIDNITGYRKFFESELSKEQLEAEIKLMLQYKKP